MKYLLIFLVSAYNKNLNLSGLGGLMSPWVLTIAEPIFLLNVIFLLHGGDVEPILFNIDNDYLIILFFTLLVSMIPRDSRLEKFVIEKQADFNYRKLHPLKVWMLYICLYLLIFFII